MPEDVFELVRANCEAWNQAVAEGGNLAAFVRDTYDPEIVMELGPLEGTITGLAGVERFMKGQAAIIEGLRSEPEEIIEAGERVVVGFRLTGRARSTGIPFELHFAHLITLRYGKALHIQLFPDTSKAMRATGLTA